MINVENMDLGSITLDDAMNLWIVKPGSLVVSSYEIDPASDPANPTYIWVDTILYPAQTMHFFPAPRVLDNSGNTFVVTVNIAPPDPTLTDPLGFLFTSADPSLYTWDLPSLTMTITGTRDQVNSVLTALYYSKDYSWNPDDYGGILINYTVRYSATLPANADIHQAIAKTNVDEFFNSFFGIPDSGSEHLLKSLVRFPNSGTTGAPSYNRFSKADLGDGTTHFEGSRTPGYTAKPQPRRVNPVLITGPTFESEIPTVQPIVWTQPGNNQTKSTPLTWVQSDSYVFPHNDVSVEGNFTGTKIDNYPVLNEVSDWPRMFFTGLIIEEGPVFQGGGRTPNAGLFDPHIRTYLSSSTSNPGQFAMVDVAGVGRMSTRYLKQAFSSWIIKDSQGYGDVGPAGLGSTVVTYSDIQTTNTIVFNAIILSELYGHIYIEPQFVGEATWQQVSELLAPNANSMSIIPSHAQLGLTVGVGLQPIWLHPTQNVRVHSGLTWNQKPGIPYVEIPIDDYFKNVDKENFSVLLTPIIYLPDFGRVSGGISHVFHSRISGRVSGG